MLGDFEKDIKINRYKLETECEEHASMYHYYSSQLAEAKTELDKASDNLKYRLSELELDVRKNWESYSDSKMTEAGVKAILETNEKIVKAKEEEREAQHEVNVLTAAVYSLDHRKTMLDNLVTLLVKGFYSVPNGQKREGINESIEKDLRKNMNRRRKEEDEE